MDISEPKKSCDVSIRHRQPDLLNAFSTSLVMPIGFRWNLTRIPHRSGSKFGPLSRQSFRLWLLGFVLAEAS